MRISRRAAALLPLVALLLVCGPAHAYHEGEEKIFDDTAYTLRGGEIQIGLWKTRYGLLDKLTLETYNLPWFLKIPSVGAKYEVYRGEDYSLSGRIGFLRVNLSNLVGLDQASGSDKVELTTWVVPVEVLNSYKLSESWSLHGGLLYTGVVTDGASNGTSAGLAVTNLQVLLGATWLWSRVTAIQLTYRGLAFQDSSVAVDTTFETGDPYTKVRAVGVVSSDALNFKDANSFVTSFVWSWESFNLRLGASLNAWSVPLFNLIVPVPFFPEFDMFWRF